MTISDRLTHAVNELDMDNLTPDQFDWLHFINTLATYVYISKYQREGNCAN